MSRWDHVMQPRQHWQWQKGHPLWLDERQPTGQEGQYWWDTIMAWCKIGGEYSKEQQRIQHWLWFWQRLSSHFQSVVSAHKTMDALNAKGLHFVRHRNGWYGRVIQDWHLTPGTPLRVLMLRDRHYNWFPSERYVECSKKDLAPIEPWPMDQLHPWDIFGLPGVVRNARFEAGRVKRAERARKQQLRREWRGLDKPWESS